MLVVKLILGVKDNFNIKSYNDMTFTAVLVSQAATDGQDVMASPIDTTVTPISKGVTLELCAGLVDKQCSIVEIAKQEVLEECGYDVPIKNFERITVSRYVYLVRIF